MFVQRLMRRLRQLVASLFHDHAADPLPPERTAVLAATLRGGPGAGATTSTGSWLDDSRRLRPHPSPLARLDQQWNTRAAGGSARQPIPTQPHSSRAAPIRPAADQPPTEATTPQIGPVTQPLPPRPPTRPDERSSVSFGPAGTSDQILHRRLMGLKRLVRLGIYNEGFDPTSIPEQYHFSLGHEDDTTSDWWA